MAEKRIEVLILKSILKNEDFARKVLPYIKDEYFEDPTEKVIYSTIYKFFETYTKLPTIEAIAVDAIKIEPSESEKINDCLDILQTDIELPDETWLVENAEKFCQERSIFLALTEAVAIYEGKDKKQDKGAIPQILSDALSVSFDPQVGHDYFEDDQKRYELYHSTAFKIPFHLDEFNKITKGGIEKQTLNIVMAGIGVGKTTFMCDLSAHYLSLGLDVLYITMEMADWKIAQKIDCNCMNVTVDELVLLPHDTFNKKIAQMKEKIKGKLIVKGYPTGSASAAHFRHTINELKLKKGFKPAIILVDYLNICASSRLKRSAGSAETSYYLKSVSEELRGLGQENDCPLWTATQFTRGGFGDSDPEMTDVGESWGIPQTADFMVGLIGGETFEKLHQRMVKQLKNRYADEFVNRKFCIGMDKPHMRFYNVEQAASDGLSDANPSEQDEKIAISKKHGSEAYVPAYNIRKFGKDKKKFHDIKVEE